MGTLVVMRYPTVLAIGAADHTYVKCNTGGKTWSCWGGNTGGTQLRRGTGSTARADAIAEPNERAGITCYLINGVCHQAANRILSPAGIFVIGARGAGLSVSIYGQYGRVSGPLGTCAAPFKRHLGVSGDLPECVSPPLQAQTGSDQSPAERDRERKYVERVNEIYGQAAARGILTAPDQVEFMLTLFMHKLEYNLDLAELKPVVGRLREIRSVAERSRMDLERAFGEKAIKPHEFVAESERQVKEFQKHLADILNPDQYQALLDVKHGEIIGLADPDIVKHAYPE